MATRIFATNSNVARTQPATHPPAGWDYYDMRVSSSFTLDNAEPIASAQDAYGQPFGAGGIPPTIPTVFYSEPMPVGGVTIAGSITVHTAVDMTAGYTGKLRARLSKITVGGSDVETPIVDIDASGDFTEGTAVPYDLTATPPQSVVLVENERIVLRLYSVGTGIGGSYGTGAVKINFVSGDATKTYIDFTETFTPKLNYTQFYARETATVGIDSFLDLLTTAASTSVPAVVYPALGQGEIPWTGATDTVWTEITAAQIASTTNAMTYVSGSFTPVAERLYLLGVVDSFIPTVVTELTAAAIASTTNATTYASASFTPVADRLYMLGVVHSSEPITVTEITAAAIASTSNATTYASASFTPTANKLYLLAVAHSDAAPETTVPTVATTTGLTFVQVGSSIAFDTLGSNLHRLTVFRAMKASGLSTGTLTVTLADAGTGCAATLLEMTNVATTGTDGADAVRNISTDAEDATANPAATMGAFLQPYNGIAAFFGSDIATAPTAGSGFTAEAHQTYATPTTGLFTQWRVTNTGAGAVSCTLSSSDWAAIAVELVAADRTPTVVTTTGLTFVQVGSSVPFDTTTSPQSSLSLFRAMKASGLGAGTFTVTLAGNGSGCAATLLEVTGVLTTGTDGADAVRNISTNSANATTNPNATMGSFLQPTNTIVAMFGTDIATSPSVPSGWTGAAHRTYATPTAGLRGQWRGYNTGAGSVNCTLSSSDWAAVAVELVAPTRTDPTIATTTGLSFVQVGSSVPFDSQSRLTLFRAMKASGLSSGTLTVTRAETAEGCAAVLTEVTGVVTTGTDGADAVRNVITRTGLASSNPTAGTMGAALNKYDDLYQVMGTTLTGGTSDPGWTVSANPNYATPTSALRAKWFKYGITGDTNTPFFSLGSSNWATIVCEVVVANSPPTVEWVSPRLKTGWTVPTAGHFNPTAYASQSSLAANVILTLRLYRRTPDGTETEFLEAATTELLTSLTSYPPNITHSVTPLELQEDDRIVLRAFATPTGTGFADGFLATLKHGAADTLQWRINGLPPLKAEADPPASGIIASGGSTVGMSNGM